MYTIINVSTIVRSVGVARVRVSGVRVACNIHFEHYYNGPHKPQNTDLASDSDSRLHVHVD